MISNIMVLLQGVFEGVTGLVSQPIKGRIIIIAQMLSKSNHHCVYIVY